MAVAHLVLVRSHDAEAGIDVFRALFDAYGVELVHLLLLRRCKHGLAGQRAHSGTTQLENRLPRVCSFPAAVIAFLGRCRVSVELQQPDDTVRVAAHSSEQSPCRFHHLYPCLRIQESQICSHPKDLTMRWSERRTAVRSTFEMTSTLSLRATRALVRRRSSCSR